MSDFVAVNGVRTWYDERGDGEPLVLLHGGFTDSRDFGGNLDRLAGEFRLLMPERRGHGHTADVPGPITVELMAADTIAFIEKMAGGPVRLGGYSAGAIVALWVAVRRPDLVSRLVLVSGAYDMAGMIVKPQAGGQMPEQLVALYAEVSPDGRDHFPTVVAKVADGIHSAESLDTAELDAVGCPALVVAADDDIITLEHTVALYRGLPHGQLAVIPNTSHLLLHEKPDQCAELIGSFLTSEHAPRMMPISRG